MRSRNSEKLRVRFVSGIYRRRGSFEYPSPRAPNAPNGSTSWFAATPETAHVRRRFCNFIQPRSENTVREMLLTYPRTMSTPKNVVAGRREKKMRHRSGRETGEWKDSLQTDNCVVTTLKGRSPIHCLARSRRTPTPVKQRPGIDTSHLSQDDDKTGRSTRVIAFHKHSECLRHRQNQLQNESHRRLLKCPYFFLFANWWRARERLEVRDPLRLPRGLKIASKSLSIIWQ